jgi:hypothetical protein
MREITGFLGEVFDSDPYADLGAVVDSGALAPA